MLVLSRKKNTSIVINGNISVTIVEIRGDKVRLGIDAPRDVSVDRLEVHESKEREKLLLSAVASDPDQSTDSRLVEISDQQTKSE